MPVKKGGDFSRMRPAGQTEYVGKAKSAITHYAKEIINKGDAMIILSYQPPYDWTWMFAFLGDRAVEGVETVTSERYRRTLAMEGHHGWLTLTPRAENHHLEVEISEGLQPVVDKVVERVRRLLDLDMNPAIVHQTLGELASNRPGLRLPGCMDVFEQGVRAILGQLVSVKQAARLTGKVVAAYGAPLDAQGEWRLFPTAAQLALADPLVLKTLGMPLKRAEALIHLARECEAGRFPLTRPTDVEHGMKALMQMPGIGRWTANYFALRGWQAQDVFLADDYAIKQRFAGMTPAQIRRYALRWQPWRSYALLHIWFSYGWRPDDQLMAK